MKDFLQGNRIPIKDIRKLACILAALAHLAGLDLPLLLAVRTEKVPN